jgi:methylated-DNA-[protein]-cysteine S-methyltransferase
MPELEFALFDTTIGYCGIVWSARGLAGVQLPEASEAATRSRVLKRFRSAQEATPPPDIKRAMDGSWRCCAASRTTSPM